MVRQRRLALEDRVDQQARLDRAAAAELDQLQRARQRAGDLAAVRREQIALDARQIVFRQPGDRFEQRRAQVVVEILRRKAERTRPQPGADVFGERRDPRRMRIAMEHEAVGEPRRVVGVIVATPNTRAVARFARPPRRSVSPKRSPRVPGTSSGTITSQTSADSAAAKPLPADVPSRRRAKPLSCFREQLRMIEELVTIDAPKGPMQAHSRASTSEPRPRSSCSRACTASTTRSSASPTKSRRRATSGSRSTTCAAAKRRPSSRRRTSAKTSRRRATGSTRSRSCSTARSRLGLRLRRHRGVPRIHAAGLAARSRSTGRASRARSPAPTASRRSTRSTTCACRCCWCSAATTSRSVRARSQTIRERLTAKHAHFEIEVYPEVGHSFFREDLGTIATRQIADAWGRVQAFLRRSLA